MVLACISASVGAQASKVAVSESFRNQDISLSLSEDVWRKMNAQSIFGLSSSREALLRKSKLRLLDTSYKECTSDETKVHESRSLVRALVHFDRR